MLGNRPASYCASLATQAAAISGCVLLCDPGQSALQSPDPSLSVGARAPVSIKVRPDALAACRGLFGRRFANGIFAFPSGRSGSQPDNRAQPKRQTRLSGQAPAEAEPRFIRGRRKCVGDRPASLAGSLTALVTPEVVKRRRAAGELAPSRRAGFDISDYRFIADRRTTNRSPIRQRPMAYACINRGVAPAFSRPSGSRLAAVSLPMDHSGAVSTSCPRASRALSVSSPMLSSTIR